MNYLGSFSSVDVRFNHVTSAWISLYLMSLLAALIVVRGGARHLLADPVALLLAFCVANAPLIENHYLISGYAEIFIAQALMLSTAFLYRSLLGASRLYLAAGVAFACVPLAIKNIGVIYSASALLAYAGAAFWSWRLVLAACSVAALPLLLYGALGELDWNLGSTRLYYDGGSTIGFGGRELRFEWQGVRPLIEVELRSKFVNSSFGVSLLMVAIASWWGLSHCKDASASRASAIKFVVVSFWLLWFLLFTSLLSQAGLLHAIEDTGHSRFAVPLFGMGSVVCYALILRLGMIMEDCP